MQYFRFDAYTGTVHTKVSQVEDPLAELKRIYGEEWFHDASPAKAVLRAGGTMDQLQALETDADVLLDRKARIEANEAPLPTREQIIMRLFEEGNYHGGSQAARVSALMNAAKLSGYVEDKVKQTGNVNHTHKGGVMVVNTAIPSRDVDAWEIEAVEQQGQLPN